MMGKYGFKRLFVDVFKGNVSERDLYFIMFGAMGATVLIIILLKVSIQLVL